MTTGSRHGSRRRPRHAAAAKKRSPAASIRIKKTSHDKRHGWLSCTENETSRLRHEGRLPGRPFSLSAAPFPCFYRVGRLWVIWKQKPWFLSVCKSAVSNKILTDLFFLNQTSRLKPPARETKERKQEGFSNDFANGSYNVITFQHQNVLTL